MNQEESQQDFEHNVEMLKYFQDEFMYRHTHYWGILTKFFIMTVVVTILPIMSEVFGVSLNRDATPTEFWYLLFFPILGLAIAILCLCILLEEAKRMTAVNRAKYRINKNMNEAHQYVYYENKTPKKFLNNKITWLVFCVEIIIILLTSVYIIVANIKK